MVILTGCSSSAPGAAPGHESASPIPEPPIGNISTITDPSQITRPIATYLPGVAQAMQLAEAEQKSLQKCLAAKGPIDVASWPDISTEEEAFIQGLVDAQKTRADLWGLFDPSGAAQFGYVLPGDSGGALTKSYPPGVKSSDYIECSEKAITSGPAVNGPDFIVQTSSLPDGGPVVPSNDSRYTKAVMEWSTCMKNAGFNYPDPISAIGDPKWHTGDTGVHSVMIATATADVQCKLSTNLVGIGLAVQSAYDEQYISDHQQALSDFQDKLNSYLRQGA